MLVPNFVIGIVKVVPSTRITGSCQGIYDPWCHPRKMEAWKEIEAKIA